MVARERSFTRAAAQLGVSQSAMSHTIRGLEAQLGLRLLTRTTRGVSPTEAGERLLASIESHYEGIDAGLAALGELREKPAGTIRITAHDHPAQSVLWPRLEEFLPQYPDITVEISINYGLIDIVGERFDAGVRSGEQVAKDMIAVRIGPPFRTAVVGSPRYLSAHPAPKVLEDLAAHRCINLRLPTHGGLYAWEFVKDGQQISVQVTGQCIFNTTPLKLTAARAGFGLTTAPEDLVRDDIEAGRLQPVLEEFWPTWPGYHLYFPSRRQASPAFSLLVDALRWRGPDT